MPQPTYQFGLDFLAKAQTFQKVNRFAANEDNKGSERSSHCGFCFMGAELKCRAFSRRMLEACSTVTAIY